jgi:hypothetical protein
MIKTNQIINTNGKGYWSNDKRAVRIVKIDLEMYDIDFAELRVYFDLRTWNTVKNGLIYTDTLFKKELKTYLKSIGLNPSDIYYSEQGMQGDNFVSFDAGPKFIKSYQNI